MSPIDLFSSVAMINYVPKIYTGDERVDRMLYTTVVISVLCFFNMERVTNVYDQCVRYLFPVSESKIAFEGSDSYYISTFYLGVTYYINKHCSDIKALIKPANNSGVVYEITGHNVHVKDDIYFTTSNKEHNNANAGGKKNVTTLIIHSKKYDIPALKSIVNSWIEEYREHLKAALDVQSIITVTFTATGAVAQAQPWSSSVTFQNRFFENKTRIIQQIDDFISNKDWYRSKGIPHNLGILLHGEPGCGKTSFIKCVANKWPKKHIINIRLKMDMRLEDLEHIMHSAYITGSIYVPFIDRVYVIEDIDCMGNLVNRRKTWDGEEGCETEQKKNETKQNNNLSFLLNILDGLNETEERVIIMTTNHMVHLDEALVRPGRIDINVQFSKAKTSEIQSILEHYWDAPETPGQYVEAMQSMSGAFTGAEIVNYCRMSTSYKEALDNMQRHQEHCSASSAHRSVVLGARSTTIYNDIIDVYRRIAQGR